MTGAAGFVAQALIPALVNHGAKVFALIHKNKPEFQLPPEQLIFVKSAQDIKNVLTGAGEALQLQAVIHLAGAGIADWPWTDKRRALLKASRWDVIDQLHESLAKAGIGFDRVLGASAVGYYGDGGEQLLTEAAPPGRGFAAELCTGVEQRLEQHATAAQARWYALRLGIILGQGGGLLSRLKLPARLGLSSIMGDGQQWFSWVDRSDVVKAIIFLCHNNAQTTQPAAGPVNLVSPQPVRWTQFAQTLAAEYGHKARLRVPEFALAPLGELKTLFLDSVKAQPKVLLDAGFEFRHANVADSLKSSLS